MKNEKFIGNPNNYYYYSTFHNVYPYPICNVYMCMLRYTAQWSLFALKTREGEGTAADR